MTFDNENEGKKDENVSQSQEVNSNNEDLWGFDMSYSKTHDGRIEKHISCEVCNPIVTGGYDSEFNQIVICQNSAYSENMVRAVLLHEMIHMFDYCRNKLDMKNIDHLACTEIRAANLAHCSFMSSLFQGDSSFINIKATHQDCVKHKARLSIMGVHKVSKEVADAAIERVFKKCYNDLEPIGRRIRRNSFDMPRAHAEAHLYGYDM
ncbi:Mitochondrial inner membrane protease ATP23 like protein [Cyphomyrmex costatus]|uniref:Mitochondrial inner membrane protease ATP23 n=1 Tax=Cyphomyrmex costatus TaxID=456900 RepID=A0A195CV38_9HYME|nr:Mitochondrial inner membrane protease ATP23 like protein [Cyphomyrmex costatus]